MAQLLPVAFALPLALAFGGRLGRLAELQLRGLWLFFLAIGIQIIAFPFAFLPWTTGEDAAKALWLVSYACLLVAAALNSASSGTDRSPRGMALNLAAILSNGGRMPATPERWRQPARLRVKHNIVAPRSPTSLARRPLRGPDWVPLTTVYAGSTWIIALGRGARLLGPGARFRGSPAELRHRPAEPERPRFAAYFYNMRRVATLLVVVRAGDRSRCGLEALRGSGTRCAPVIRPRPDGSDAKGTGFVRRRSRPTRSRHPLLH